MCEAPCGREKFNNQFFIYHICCNKAPHCYLSYIIPSNKPFRYGYKYSRTISIWRIMRSDGYERKVKLYEVRVPSKVAIIPFTHYLDY